MTGKHLKEKHQQQPNLQEQFGTLSKETPWEVGVRYL